MEIDKQLSQHFIIKWDDSEIIPTTDDAIKNFFCR